MTDYHKNTNLIGLLFYKYSKNNSTHRNMPIMLTQIKALSLVKKDIENVHHFALKIETC